MVAIAAEGIPSNSPARQAAFSPAHRGLVLQTLGLTKSYGGLQAVAGVDLALARGQITGLIGPNGAGKTTLLNLISGVEKPSSGAIVHGEVDVTGLPPHRLAARGLVRTFQICRDLGELTVLENLLVAQPRQAGESVFGAFFKGRRVRREEEAAVEHARAILQSVNLWPLADERAASLSGGQKKLLELCRALMAEPQIVLLDEPAAGVAPAMEQVLVATIRSLVARGVTFLILEHDLDVVAALCHHVYVMAAGRVLTEGSFEEVTSDSRVLEAYLGAAT